MNKTLKTILIIVLCAVLIAAVALCISGNRKTEAPDTSEKAFTFIVADIDGNEKTFSIKSSKPTVGEALVDEGLIEGEQGNPGFYVKYVDGIRADYDLDGVYWAFYVNGEYATSGVDTTKITDGATYSFRVEK